VKTGWLLRGGEVLAAAEEADRVGDRMRGLLGQRDYDGAMLFPRTKSVHTIGMHFAVDVAFIAKDGTVIDLCRLGRWRMCSPRRHTAAIVEARAGAFERWGLATGDVVEFREVT
jgi:uncharacterized membrane protein (UPF0127 family)